MNSFVKLFTLSLLLSWSCAVSSTTSSFRSSTSSFRSALLPQPSSALLAADTLRSRGYSIFASLLVSISSTTNFTGTLLAPPDFAFSFASTKILNNHRPPPRPSIPSLLYHTLRPPLILTWPTLSSRDDGDELRTYYNNFCLHLFKSSFAGEVSISSSPFRNPMASVKIRQPDLYVDEHLTVHGIDGVLSPSLGTRCSVMYSDPTADAVPLQVNRVFLDHAMRALRRKGYHAVAAAMSIRRADLLPLTSVTVFAISDEHLFMTPGGFHYDFRHHVIPIRHRFVDLAKLTAGRRTEFYTLAPNKTVAVVSNDGVLSVDGVPVGMREVYHNRWIVVVSVISSLDDVDQPTSDDSAPSPSPFSDVPSPAPIHSVSAKRRSSRFPSPPPTHGKSHRVPSPPTLSGIFARRKSPRAPSPSPESESGNPTSAPEAADGPTDAGWAEAPSPNDGSPSSSPSPSEGGPSSSPSPSPDSEAENPVSSPAPSPAEDDLNVIHCDLNVVISNGVEGGDLLCPDRQVRKMRERERFSGDDVEQYQPFDAHGQDAEDLTQSDDEAKIAEHVNIADDVFFYS